MFLGPLCLVVQYFSKLWEYLAKVYISSWCNILKISKVGDGGVGSSTKLESWAQNNSAPIITHGWYAASASYPSLSVYLLSIIKSHVLMLAAVVNFTGIWSEFDLIWVPTWYWCEIITTDPEGQTDQRDISLKMYDVNLMVALQEVSDRPLSITLDWQTRRYRHVSAMFLWP